MSSILDALEALLERPSAARKSRPKTASTALSSPETFPAEWKTRLTKVMGQARPMRVPRHIVRIDIEGPGRGSTHGWQVRYREVPSRFFSDSKHDRAKHLGTPAESLLAAKHHLLSIWTGPVVPALRPERADKLHPTGMTGVRVIWRKKGSLKECFVRVDALDGTPLANFYVGTENTVRQAHLERRLREAKKLRREYLAGLGMLDRLPKETRKGAKAKAD